MRVKIQCDNCLAEFEQDNMFDCPVLDYGCEWCGNEMCEACYEEHKQCKEEDEETSQ